jgi:hypothetical protein
MRYAFNGLLLVLVAFVACLAGACSSDGNNTAAGGSGGVSGAGGSGGGGPPGTTTIGERGGVADSASGDGSTSIPSGAIASGTIDITVEERITTNSSFTVTGLAGPPEGQGRWIDFATGPNFESGLFDIGANGQFTSELEIPPLGFRYLGLTDACLGPFVTETNGWLYNLEVWCGPNCGQSTNAAPCQLPQTVTMQQVGMSSAVAATFAFTANEQCTLGQWQGLPRVLEFSRDAFGVLGVVVIMGVNRWSILSSSEGTERVPGAQWVDLPDGTDIVMTVRDADDGSAPIYELRYRIDGDDLTIRSFIEL